MSQHSRSIRLLALALIAALPALSIPVGAAEPAGATLRGSIVSAASRAPLAGARLHAADPRTGRVYASAPADARGNFKLEGLPAASYEIGVESGDRLYLVDAVLRLAPGQARDVSVAVREDAAADSGSSSDRRRRKAAGVWNNPGAAAGIVISGAVVLGILVNEATKGNEPFVSTTQPL